MPAPHPTDRPGLLRLLAPTAQRLEIRFAPLSDRDEFNPAGWVREPFNASPTRKLWLPESDIQVSTRFLLQIATAERATACALGANYAAMPNIVRMNWDCATASHFAT
jgi:hypothetical protein